MNKERLSRLYRSLQEQGCDAYFVTSPANVRYLSGYTGDEAYLLAAPGKNWLITDFRYRELAEREAVAFQVVMHRNSAPALPEVVRQYCEELGAEKLMIEKRHITYAMYAELEKSLSGRTEIAPGNGLAEELRYVKDPEEIVKLRIACSATDRVFSAICDYIRPGVTEKDIAREMRYLIEKENCDNGFSLIVASGVNGSLPHAIPQADKAVQPGELVTLDFGCLYQGYHADMTRTVMVGVPADWQKELYAIVQEANRRAEALIRDGAKGKDVDAAARDYIAAQGYGEHFGHGLGHGVGLEIHEDPFMSRICPHTLQSGCVVTVEPGIYLPGRGGCRIEDSVLVTDDGAEVLFASTKDMVIL